MKNNLENEVWKPIAGYEGLYEISNFGRVYSIPRNGTYGGIRIPYPDKDGYMRISLQKNHKKQLYGVHRLVAIAFIENDDPIGKPLVNHKDFNRENNSVDNLE